MVTELCKANSSEGGLPIVVLAQRDKVILRLCRLQSWGPCLLCGCTERYSVRLCPALVLGKSGLAHRHSGAQIRLVLLCTGCLETRNTKLLAGHCQGFLRAVERPALLSGTTFSS